MIEAAPPAELESVQQRSLIIGAVGLVLLAVGIFINPKQFFHSYLLGYVFWTGIALGCLAILLLQHLTGGGWGLVIRRFLEAGAKTLPLMAILFLPIVIDLFWGRHLYIWSNPEAVKVDEILKHKALYLNAPFFVVRTVIYFAIWLGMAQVLNRWSLEQDKAGAANAMELNHKFQKIAGIGVLVFGLTITFASFDWLMSLDPHWFSTIFGLLFLAGQVLSAFAFVIIVASLFADRKPLHGVLLPHHFHDLGKLLLAFVMIWAYFSLSQYLIIWSANLPEEIPWFLHRLEGGWRYLSIGIILLHFALPFVLLLSRGRKQNHRRLIIVAVLVLVMRFVDLFWIVAPEYAHEPKIIKDQFSAHGFHMSLFDIAAPIGVGGIWLWLFLNNLRAKPLLPVHDPYLQEALHHAGH
jgi:Ni/Fe-hydrogenase subunit HybB-like protein